MTEFTSEWIAGAREVVGNDDASPSGQIAFIALDEIERLQARVQELEHYEKLLHEWVHERVEGLDNLEEIEKMVRLVDDINRKNAGVACGWCNETFDTKDEIKQHAMTCKDNPLAQRIIRLQTLIENLFMFLENDRLVRAHASQMSEFINEYRNIKASLPNPPKDGEG